MANRPKTDIIAFAYGRFNPPTIGHQKLIEAVKDKAGQNNWLIFPSRSNDPKKNPLKFDVKVSFMKRIFSDYKEYIHAGDENRLLITALQYLQDKDYKQVILCCGSDRVAGYTSMFERTHGKDFTFESWEVHNIGERDPDGDEVSAMSASLMREAAKMQRTETFISGIPGDDLELKLDLMAEVRKGMGL